MRRGTRLLFAVALAACSRAEPTVETTARDAGNAAPPSTSATAAAVSAPTSGPSTWSGHYSATVGSLFVPDWTGVRFRGEDASAGLGDGAMSVTLDATGRARGTLDGALGEGTVDGAVRGDDFGATLVPADAAHGFSGTAIGTREGNRITGTMRLSLPTGNVIREASFTLDRKP